MLADMPNANDRKLQANYNIAYDVKITVQNFTIEIDHKSSVFYLRIDEDTYQAVTRLCEDRSVSILLSDRYVRGIFNFLKCLFYSIIFAIKRASCSRLTCAENV